MALSMRPTGWFQIGWSGQYAVGDVSPFKLCGNDLVAFRTESGRLVVLSAYCQHLGAHLGYGGCVDGENIVCPFHGWQWTPEGTNALIPYQDRPNYARKVQPWVAFEKHGVAFVWHDVHGRDPLWDVPDLFTDVSNQGLSPADHYRPYPEAASTVDDVTMHPQYMIENGVDFAHFKYVHRSALPEILGNEQGETWFRASMDLTYGAGKEKTWLTPTGPAKVTLHNLFSGVGITFSAFEGADAARTILAVTPIDDKHCTVYSTVWLPRLPGDTGDALPEKLLRRLHETKRQVVNDVEIWRRMQYTEPAGLATAEGKGFTEMRRWARRFYPDDKANSMFEGAHRVGTGVGG